VRLLIADDDAEMRTWLRAVLESQGAELREVESGAELVRALASDGPFDLVITDVRMSWASGLQALAMVRTAGNRTPFVVITAHADTDVYETADELGVQLLEKPLSPQRLLEAAEAVLARAALTSYW